MESDWVYCHFRQKKDSLNNFLLKNLPFVKEAWVGLSILKSKLFKKIVRKYAERDALHKIISRKSSVYWENRIQLVLDSPDNAKINYGADTGKFNSDHYFIMHNGVIINPFSYYGVANFNLLLKNKSVHEPQEEYAFQEIIKEIPTSGTMIELGSYWAFYSMWFNKQVAQAKNYMIDPLFVDWGKENFKINGMKGDFTRAFVSNKSGDRLEGVPTVCVDDFMRDKGINFVDLLHSDIQGFEYDMLLGSEKLLDEKNVGYIFISTHSNEIHEKCSNYLKEKGFTRVCGHNLDESFAWDGLLVFKNPDYPGVETIELSKRSSS